MMLRSAAAVAAMVPFLALATPAGAENSALKDDLVNHPVVSVHQGVFNGKHVIYKASVEAVIVADGSGKPAARLVDTSYIATSVGNATKRPVIFAFNGGPITPSDIIHMGMLGPKRVAIPDDVTASPSTYKVVDNRYTLLDVADLVFIDPASTGFSRVLEGVDPKGYFSVPADAQQVAAFIAEWSRKHGRLDAPKYVIGESYGTIRAAAVADQLQKLPTPVPLSGVVIIGQALNIVEFSQRPANIISYVASLPTIAAIAWSQGKANAHGKSFDDFEDEVRQFARTDYLTALFQGAKLSDDERRKIAARLEDYSGIPAAFYLANNLEISKERYRRELFKDRHEILGMIDARYAGPNPASGPAPDPAGVITAAYESAFKTYLHDDLKIDDVDDYTTRDPVEDGWNYGGAASPFSDWPFPTLLTNVFAANPKFRLMVMNGYEDTQTTVGAAQYLVDRSGWPQDRVSIHFYQGGHTAYSVEGSLRRMTSDIRVLVTQP
jgi:carboxypeptidase C (cathepsin A)